MDLYIIIDRYIFAQVDSYIDSRLSHLSCMENFVLTRFVFINLYARPPFPPPPTPPFFFFLYSFALTLHTIPVFPCRSPHISES